MVHCTDKWQHIMPQLRATHCLSHTTNTLPPSHHQDTAQSPSHHITPTPTPLGYMMQVSPMGTHSGPAPSASPPIRALFRSTRSQRADWHS